VPAYERQRAQSTNIPNPDVNHALCAYGYTRKKGRPIRRHAKSRYAYCPQADHRQLERLLIEALSNLRCSVRSIDINILVRSAYERQRTRLTDISEPDINHTLYVPMEIHIERVSLYAGIPSLDMLYPQADR
jgi:hypothetical protein